MSYGEIRFHSIYNLNPPNDDRPMSEVERYYETLNRAIENYIDPFEYLIERNMDFLEEEEQELADIIKHEPRVDDL